MKIKRNNYRNRAIAALILSTLPFVGLAGSGVAKQETCKTKASTAATCGGIAAAQGKMRSIRLYMELENASIPDIVEFLCKRSRELDPEKQGIVFKLDPDDPDPGISGKAWSIVFEDTMPLGEALLLICRKANLRFWIAHNVVMIGSKKTFPSGHRDFQSESEIALKEGDVVSFSDIVKTWAAADPAAASKWAIKLPEGEEKEGTLLITVSAWAGADSKSAADWALELPEERGRSAALLSVADGWARKDPKAAAEWAMKLDGYLKTRVLYNVLSIWARTDAAGAKHWLKTLRLPQT